jgi:hypothetical protein
MPNDLGQAVEDGHTFRLDSTGDIDIWALDIDYHNGPYCTSCDEVFCEHCIPEIYREPCPVASVRIPLW